MPVNCSVKSAGVDREESQTGLTAAELRSELLKNQKTATDYTDEHGYGREFGTNNKTF